MSAIQSVLKHVGKLDRATQDLLVSGQLRASEGDMYLRASITGAGGTIDLIDETTEKKAGVTNFNGNKLEKLQNLTILALRGAYGSSDAAAGTDNPAEVKYSVLQDNIPAALINADLVITQNDRPIIEIPMQRLFSEGKSNRPTGTEDAFELQVSQLLTEQQPIGIQLRFPKGVNMPAGAKHFFELHLLGVKTIKR